MHKHIKQTEQQQANEDENTNERNEAKENRLKVLWLAEFDLPMPFVCVIECKVIYPQAQVMAHLAWVLPVPTPPPNCLV